MCETLWHSKGSLPSSSDLDTGEKSQEINFEEKLEEANSLIEKVRKALRDIGKGIYKLPEQKKSQHPELICSFLGCPARAKKDHQSAEASPKATTEKVADVVPKEKKEVVDVAQQQQQQLNVNGDDGLENGDVDDIQGEDVIIEPDEIATLVAIDKEGCSAGSLAELENERTFSPAKVSVKNEDNDELTNAYLESLRRIQEKLQTISEMSDNENCPGDDLKKCKGKIVQAVHRATSPIDMSCPYRTICHSTAPRVSERVFLLTQETQTSSNVINIEKCKKECEELAVKKSRSTTLVDLQTQTSSNLISIEMCKKECRELSEKKSQTTTLKDLQTQETQTEQEEVASNCECEECEEETEIDSTEGGDPPTQETQVVDNVTDCKMVDGNCEECACLPDVEQDQPKVEDPVQKALPEEEVASQKQEESRRKESRVSYWSRKSSEKSTTFNLDEPRSLKTCGVLDAPKEAEETDSKKLLEKKSSNGTKDPKKLSIQVMPPVSIRSGLTTQRTLNLCIKPTGSATNDLTVKPNVAYEEVKLDTGGEERSEKCPRDCRNDEGGNCIAKVMKDVHLEVQNLKLGVENVEKDVSGIKKNIHKLAIPIANVPSILSTNSKYSTDKFRDRNSHAATGDSVPENLRQNALYMFRSFQIMDNEIETRLRSKHAHVDVEQKSPEESEDAKKSCSKCRHPPTQSHETKEKVQEDVVSKIEKGLYMSQRSPWDIGFYKTTATQCSSNTSLHLPTQLPPPPVLEDRILSVTSEDQTYMDFSMSNYPDVASYKKPSVAMTIESLQSDRLMTVVKDSQYDQLIGSPMTSVSPRSTTEVTSPKSSLEESSLRKDGGSLSTQSSEEDKDSPVQDFRPSKQISITEILSILTENNKERDLPEEGSILGKKPTAEVRKLKKKSLPSDETPKIPGASNGGFIPATNGETAKFSREKVRSETNQIAPKLSAKSLRNSSSESDSSDSSYSSENVHGSIDSPNREDTAHHQPTGVKRPHPDEAKSPPTTIKEDIPSLALDDKEAENYTKGKKTDAVMQTSLASSEETSSEGSGIERDRIATIKYFIKGLTGTSQEELAKLTSTSSVPKTDLPSYSRTVLKTLQEQRISRVGDNSQNPKSSKEIIVETTEYAENDSLAEKSPENDDNLSERTKLLRLREFQKMASAMYSVDETATSATEKSEKDKVVMNVTEQRDDFGGGIFYTKRQIPFYRRVLGRIIDVKKPMQTSQSDPNPIEESFSEGEIKCRSSASIGEIHPFKYFNNDRKKLSKGAVKYLKKHHEEMIRKDLGDRSHRIARQRTQYNSWVTYYLQKHQNFSMGDDSSSPMNSSKR